MKVTEINTKKMSMAGIVIAVGLALALIYIIFYVFTKESERAENRPVESSVPIQPETATPTVSPESEAPSADQ